MKNNSFFGLTDFKPFSIFLKVLLLSSSIAILNSSCKKYLDKKPNNNLTTPTTLVDLQALLDDDKNMNVQRTPNFSEASSDDYFLPDATYTTRSTLLQNIYKWTPSDYFYDNDWSFGYYSIYRANLCLEVIKNIVRSGQNQEQWDNIKGSALFFRAYYFLELLWQHGKAYDELTAGTDLGIVLRLSSDFNVRSVRSSVQESYERVITDIKEAIPYLLDNPLHVMRPSRAAAYGLLSRTYLSMRNYDSAFKYSNLCLDIKNTLLDYNIVANSANPFVPYAFGTSGEVIFYTEMSSAFAFSIISPLRARIDTTLYSSYAGNDLRKNLFFQASTGPGGYQQFKGSYSRSSGVLFTGISTNEMMLIRSECYARHDSIAKSMQDLNSLISKRWKNTVSYPILNAVNKADALNLILSERRKELLMRGLRLMDIKRFNKEGRLIVPERLISGQEVKLEPNSNYYALPLPTDIIQQTGMPQN